MIQLIFSEVATINLKVMTEKEDLPVKVKVKVMREKENQPVKVKMKVMTEKYTNQLGVDEEGGDANYPHFLPDNQIGILIVAIMMMIYIL